MTYTRSAKAERSKGDDDDDYDDGNDPLLRLKSGMTSVYRIAAIVVTVYGLVLMLGGATSIHGSPIDETEILIGAFVSVVGSFAIVASYRQRRRHAGFDILPVEAREANLNKRGDESSRRPID